MNKKQKILATLALSLALFFPLTKIVKAREDVQAIMVGHYILGYIGSLLVKAAGFLVNLFIKLNFEVAKTPFVQTGWQITRDLTNLGFVLIIIVIAIATILRIQQYGAKSTLGKLIAVALLVNFSLVIAGVFIDFSNMLTYFFIKNVTSLGPGEMAGALATVFAPQKILDIKLEKGEEAGWTDKLKGLIDAIADPGKALTALLTWIAGLFFVIVFTLVLAFTLFALAIMFLIRFVSLSILLVLAPLAFLFSILPATKKLWNQWWQQFMKWILFAPVASFFLYLGVKLAFDYRSEIEKLAKDAQGKGTTANLAFADVPNVSLIPQMATGAILVGFILGGLIAADKMGITGAKTFMGAAQTAGKWAQGAVGRGALRAGTWPARTEWGQKAAGALSRAGTRLPTGLRWVGAPVRGIGTAMSRAGGAGERLVEDAAKRQKRISSDRLAAMTPGLGGFELVAALERGVKEKNLGKIHDVSHRYLNQNTKNLFKRYGRGDVFGDLEKSLGMNTEMHEAIRAGDERKAQGAAKTFFAGYSKKDWNKLQMGNIYSEKPTLGLDKNSHDLLQEIVAHGITINNPGDVSKILVNVKAKDFDRAHSAITRARASIGQTNPELAKSILKALDRTMTKRMTGEPLEFPTPEAEV